jgi:hypothetical protein
MTSASASDPEAPPAPLVGEEVREREHLLPETIHDYGSEGPLTKEHRGTTFLASFSYKTHRALICRNDDVVDAMTYHTQDLSSWNSLLQTSYTVWNRRSLWMIALKLLGLSTVVALLVLVTVRDPAALEVGKFAEISAFLRVFVGLLLGFFMSASVHRWWSCADGFHHLCSAVRSLHISLNSLGVPEEQMVHILRYGVLSAWILHMQLHVDALPTDKQRDGVSDGWGTIASGEGHDAVFGQVLPEELESLHEASDPPGNLWMWIGSRLGNLAEEGVIPGLATPTYGRLLGISLDGFNAIRSVRTSISVQAPFIYVQMLSSLVHINNIVNAVSFGLTWGASIGTMLVYWHVHIFTPLASDAKATEGQASRDTQSLLVSFVFSCFGPFVYQALLEVSIAIAQPFSNKDAVVPTARIIHLLERDLHDGLRMAKQISWTQPHFKK